MKRIALIGLLLASGAQAQTTGQDTSWRTGDRMAGSVGTSPQGQAIVQKVLPTTASGVAIPAGTAADPIYTTGGGGSSVPTGTAGNPNTAVVTVQGISGATPQNVNNSQVSGTAISTGTGATDAGTQRFVLAATQPTLNVTSAGTDNITAIGGSALTLGQKTQANSIPVALSSDGTYATAANQNSTAAGTSATSAQGVQGVTGGVPLPTSTTNGATAANQPAVATAGSAAPTTGLEIFGLANSGTPVATTAGNGVRLWLGTSGQVAFGGQNISDGASLSSGNGTFDMTGVGRPLAALGYVSNGSGAFYARGDTTGAYVVPQPVATASAGIAPTGADGATSAVLKASAGNLYRLTAVNGSTAGFLVVINATAAPTSGTATPAGTASGNRAYCMSIAASQSLDVYFQTPIAASTGIVAGISTACATWTPVGTNPVTITGQAK